MCSSGGLSQAQKIFLLMSWLGITKPCILLIPVVITQPKPNCCTSAGGGAAEAVCPPAHELAWNYDVVITTFQRLSSDWSMRGDPRMAERLVLLKVRLR
jgi:hypothetical protein